VDRVGSILDGLAGRRVLVVGLARSGAAAARVLAERGAHVIGTDRRSAVAAGGDLAAAGVELHLGGDRPELAAASELVVLSPGVPLDGALAAAARGHGVALIGELELAWRLAAVETVAVTGTNGKSTTTALCAHLLERAGRRVFLGGNIGRPLSELLLPETAAAAELAVVEVSSFQLEHLSADGALVPRVGVWLNLTPDHLDRHGDQARYGAVKRRLFAGQGPEQTAVLFADDGWVQRMGEGLAARRRAFGRDARALTAGDCRIDGRRLLLDSGRLELRNPRLAGDHNAENAAAAVLAAAELGVGLPDLQAGLDDFTGLTHRLEPVRELGGVRWINDSKGTNPDATAKSLTGFAGGVILIAGGRGKGTDYRKLRPVVAQRVRRLLLLGEDRERLAADLEGAAELELVADLEAAVARAQQLARPGDTVLLSPACASFDMFDDYAHRGDVFRSLVEALEAGS
jgi:UDP-N-acetylmuramoylalanine--D-glutamate ligase